jgi:hypothetical protein
MYGIDYYPYRKRSKNKSKFLILTVLLTALVAFFLALTSNKPIENDSLDLIIISEPKNVESITVMENKFETLDTKIEPVYEIEQLDAVFQIQNK